MSADLDVVLRESAVRHPAEPLCLLPCAVTP